jgi:folylpolyglutamate synthase/dihydrofolate synthase
VSRAGTRARVRSVRDAADWLSGLIDVERRPDWPYRRFSLDAIHALLARLGHPGRGLPILHIAGSKGKGSTALMAEAILCGAGRRVGTFTSPHLERWTERFRVDGVEVEEDRLVAAVEAVRPHVESLREESASVPTFFDATTAAALVLFRAAGVDSAILEVGLGGRLDSTNACVPAVTCITSIELEHTERLGHTLALIAGEKAGILKPGVPAVLGALPEEALAVVLRRAAELGAPVSRIGRDFGGEVQSDDLDGVSVRIWDGALEARPRLPLLGAPCAHNAALATTCVARLLGGAFAPETLAEVVGKALAQVALPAHRGVGARARGGARPPRPSAPSGALDLRGQGHARDPRSAPAPGPGAHADASRARSLAGSRGARGARAADRASGRRRHRAGSAPRRARRARGVRRRRGAVHRRLGVSGRHRARRAPLGGRLESRPTRSEAKPSEGR